MRGTGDLAGLLATALAKRGLTQAAAASDLGVSQQTLSRWISGSVQPGDDKLFILSEFLDVSIDDLLELRSTRTGNGRVGVSRRITDLEERAVALETRLSRLAERLELLADRLDRLVPTEPVRQTS